MAEIAPLTPLRYDLERLPNGLASVVAPPYDVIGPEERNELAQRDEHNIVRLILPHPPQADDADSRYAHAGKLLADWRREGVLIRDSEPAFYRYDQTFLPPGGGVNGNAKGTGTARAITRRGFLALVKLEPFSARVVLPHERTLSGPKEDRLKLFRATQTNLSPGFMLYRDVHGALDAPLETGTVLTEFATPDGIHHVLAKVTARDALRAIAEGVARSSLLIADGHHRYETALRYCEEVSAARGPEAARSPRGEHRYFMTFLVNGDDPNLVVFPTHRHVHGLASFSFDDLVQRAAETFVVRALPQGIDAAGIQAAIAAPHGGMASPTLAAAAVDGRVAVFTLRRDVDLAAHPTLGSRPAVLRDTDVAVLHSAVLEHLLGITPEAQAAKTNLWYPQDARAALEELRGERPTREPPKGQVLFVMNATPVAAVRDVAEAGEVMPQKSTFFFPKVLTGLAVHTLDPTRSAFALD